MTVIQPVIFGGKPYALGDEYGGGILACIYGYSSSGTPTGLVVSSVDISTSHSWSTVSSLSAGTSIEPGSGLLNCDNIISQSGHTSSAASACRQYDGGGYTDWVLPSKADWLDMIKWVSGSEIRSGYYWTSSESTSTTSFAFAGSNYTTTASLKSFSFKVRAIRYI